MVALVVICSALTVTGFVIGWVLADNKLFWDRQNWASKVDGRF